MTDNASAVYLILDPLFGAKIQELPADVVAWIIMSDENEPYVRQRWETDSGTHCRCRITGFQELAPADADASFASQLANIEMHHGSQSEARPFTTLNVVGVQLARQAEHELRMLGFTTFSESERGFIAARPAAEAGDRRE